MKQSLRWSLAAVLALAAASTAGAAQRYTHRTEFVGNVSIAQLIDFEDYPPGSHVAINGHEYAAQGVVFSSPLAPPEDQLWVESGPYYNSNFLSVDLEPFVSPRNHDDLIIDFLTPTRAFGIDFVDNGGGGQESITVYGANGVIFVEPAIPNQFWGIVTDEDIVSIVFDEHPSDFDDIGYDNITLGVPAGQFVLADSDILIAGHDAPGQGPNPTLIRADGNNGDILWQKPIPLSIWGGDHHFLGDRNLPEDAFYLASRSDEDKTASGENRILKLDANGDLVWDIALSVAQFRISANPVDGGVYAVERTTPGNLYKLDTDGNVTWTVTGIGGGLCGLHRSHYRRRLRQRDHQRTESPQVRRRWLAGVGKGASSTPISGPSQPDRRRRLRRRWRLRQIHLPARRGWQRDLDQDEFPQLLELWPCGEPLGWSSVHR